MAPASPRMASLSICKYVCCYLYKHLCVYCEMLLVAIVAIMLVSPSLCINSLVLSLFFILDVQEDMDEVLRNQTSLAALYEQGERNRPTNLSQEKKKKGLNCIVTAIVVSLRSILGNL